MKRKIVIAASVILLCSAFILPTEVSTTHRVTKNKPAKNKSFIASKPETVMLGTWTGEMGGKKLTVVIEKIKNKELIGYNMLGTNKRNLKGTFKDAAWDQSCSKAYDAVLKEPGDDKWDGVFTIKFIGYEDQVETDTAMVCGGNLKGSEAMGGWKANNGKMKKEFTLTKQSKN